MPRRVTEGYGGIGANAPPTSLRVGEVVSALSQALDLGAGSTAWHSVRTCILGMRIAAELKLPENIQNNLYYALLLKDAGCSAGSARAGQGATLARLIGLPEQTALGIANLDKHWDGKDSVEQLHGESIPIVSRITLLAQTLDVGRTIAGCDAALSLVTEKAGSWFDPNVVQAVCSLTSRGALWSDWSNPDPLRIVLTLEPRFHTMAEGDVTLDAICQAFAAIVDAKSPFTYNHSNGVANVAVSMALKLGLDRSRVLFVRHAALLHDLGKMAVSNAILQKAGALDPFEWRIMRSHPEHTWRILRSIHGFEYMSEVAASHHEKLDGSGYFRGLPAEHLSTESRILAIADVFDALSTERPYRKAMPPDRAFAIIREGCPHAFDPTFVEALEQADLNGDRTFRDIYALQHHLSEADNQILRAVKQ